MNLYTFSQCFTIFNPFKMVIRLYFFKMLAFVTSECFYEVQVFI